MILCARIRERKTQITQRELVKCLFIVLSKLHDYHVVDIFGEIHEVRKGLWAGQTNSYYRDMVGFFCLVNRI